MGERQLLVIGLTGLLLTAAAITIIAWPSPEKKANRTQGRSVLPQQDQAGQPHLATRPSKWHTNTSPDSAWPATADLEQEMGFDEVIAFNPDPREWSQRPAAATPEVQAECRRHWRKVMSSARRSNWQEVLAETESILQLDRSWESAHYYRGLALWHLGEVGPGYASLKIAAALRPNKDRYQKALDKVLAAMIDTSP